MREAAGRAATMRPATESAGAGVWTGEGYARRVIGAEAPWVSCPGGAGGTWAGRALWPGRGAPAPLIGPRARV